MTEHDWAFPLKVFRSQTSDTNKLTGFVHLTAAVAIPMHTLSHSGNHNTVQFPKSYLESGRIL